MIAGQLAALTAAARPAVAPPPSYTGPLDLTATPAVVAYGQRAMSAAKLGTAIYTIRRSSDDATQSFSSDATTGEAPVASISAFIGGGGGFLSTWNDQSGNASNALQATAGKQPSWIANATNARPAVGFNPVNNQFFGTAGNVTLAGSATMFFLTKINNKAKAALATIADGGSGYDDGVTPSTFNVTIVGGTDSIAAVANVSTDGTGVVTAVNGITVGRYTAVPANPAATTGDDGVNHGSGLTLDVTWVQKATLCGMNWSDSEFENGPDMQFLVGTLTAYPDTTLLFGADSLNFATHNAFGTVANSFALDTYVLVEITWTASAGEIRIDGAVQALDADTAGDVGDISLPLGVGTNDIFQATAGDFEFWLMDGVIAEQLIFPALSDADRLAIRQNIAAYYGIVLS